MWKKTDQDILLLSQIAKEITGCNFDYIERPAINCINQRMESLNFDDLVRYIDFALKNKGEFARLISSLTIHTTYWFREPKHFTIVKKWIVDQLEQEKNLDLKVWSAACSTGEEVYSLACLLETIREQFQNFDYSVLGTDIDPLSVNHARSAVYTEYDKEKFGDYSRFIEFSNSKSNEFTMVPSILNRCYFDVMSLFELKIPPKTINLVFIRNVLIYFNTIEVKKILNEVKDILVDDGLLVTGMSESIVSPDFFKLENTAYKKTNSKSIDSKKIIYFGKDKVFSKKYFSLVDHNTLEIVTTDNDQILKSKLQELNHCSHAYFDLSDRNFKTYLDLLSSFKENISFNLYLVYNSESVENHISKAFKYKLNLAGFLNKAFVSKKSLSFYGESKSTEKKQSHRPKRFKPKLIVLGASTGGVDALVHVLTGIGPNCPPIVVLQHINLYFSKPFVTRIADLANLKVSSCQENEVVQPGHIYSPTGNYNISLEERDGKIVINRNKNQVADHWPLIDYTFESISYLSIPKAAILLTGMGSDGAIGMKKIHNTDSYCMAQDQQSSVVYGMPKIAKQLGAYDYIGDLDQIRSKLLGMI